MSIRLEERLHVAVARYLAMVLRPPVFWTSVDAGSGKLSPRAAGMAKARGVKAGIPDVMVFAPRSPGFKVIGLELKTPKGRVSLAQVETMRDMSRAGVHCYVARSIDDVDRILRAEGVPVHGRVM